MKSQTSEFSFILKPSQHGVGVFAAEDIKKDAHLRLFGDNETIEGRSVVRKKKDVPEPFLSYCMDRDDEVIAPADFGQMCVGWYLNHSETPNTYPDDDYKWYAARDIVAGEEITINYNALNEPEAGKESYYR